MALSFTNLLQDGNAAAQTSYATASVTPTANRLLLLGINAGTGSGTQPTVPSVSGCGLTWVHVATVDYDTSGTSDRQSCFLFRAMGANPTTEALTIDFASTGEALGRGVSWVLDESSADVDTSGTHGSGAIVQSATATGASNATSLTVTLGAFADAADNAAYGYFAKQNATAFTPGSGFTLLGEPATPTNRRAMSEYRVGEDTTVDCSWTTGIRSGGIAVEVKAAAAGLGATLGVTTETDVAQPAGRSKRRTAGAAAETDAALPVARSKRKALPVTTESASAQPVGRRKVRTVGTAAETGGSQPIGRRKVRMLPVLTETDEAVPLLLQDNGVVQPAAEADTAVPLGRVKRKTVGAAAETGAAVAAGRMKQKAALTASETSASVSLSRGHRRALGAALEVGGAVILGRLRRRLVGTTSEVDEAAQVTGGTTPAHAPGQLTVSLTSPELTATATAAATLTVTEEEGPWHTPSAT